MSKYKVVDGTSYYINTPKRVIELLEYYRVNKCRIRVFYGDSKTGRDWLEEFDTIGVIGRSTGDIKVPILLSRVNSNGGSAILTDCIVKITVDKQVVYKHPLYHIVEEDIPKGLERFFKGETNSKRIKIKSWI